MKSSSAGSVLRLNHKIVCVRRLVENISKKLWRFKKLHAIWLIRKNVFEEPIYVTSANSDKINVNGIACIIIRINLKEKKIRINILNVILCRYLYHQESQRRLIEPKEGTVLENLIIRKSSF